MKVVKAKMPLKPVRFLELGIVIVWAQGKFLGKHSVAFKGREGCKGQNASPTSQVSQTWDILSGLRVNFKENVQFPSKERREIERESERKR